MPDNESLEARVYEHVVGKGSPMQLLLDTGVLSHEWADTYLALLREADEKWKHQPSWPPLLVAAIHVASFYLNLRYSAWTGFEKKRNEATETLLGHIRTRSETFLLSPIIAVYRSNTKKPEGLSQI